MYINLVIIVTANSIFQDTGQNTLFDDSWHKIRSLSIHFMAHNFKNYYCEYTSPLWSLNMIKVALKILSNDDDS